MYEFRKFIFETKTLAIVLNLFLSMIATIIKAAKTIKTVELQKKVTFSDFAGEFFLLWFSPIGIWILQPKINKFAS